MSAALEGAIDALLEELVNQENEVRETKRTINNLLRRVGKEPRFTDLDGPATKHSAPSIRADQFYGKPLATVTREVLEMRKQATSAEELIRLLSSGGFDFDSAGWKEGDRLRSFTITLSKNNKTFHRLPSGHFGLAEWYPDAINKKKQKQLERNASEPSPEAEPGIDSEEVSF